MLTFNSNNLITQFKEGIALFNSFSGDTHFLEQPYDKIIMSLAEAPQDKSLLLESTFRAEQSINQKFEEEFEQFISEAINSGIINEL